MNLEYAVCTKMVSEDDETMEYGYGDYDWSEPEFQTENHIYDGPIIVL